MMKECTKCKRNDVSFYKDKNAKNGFRSICKICDIERRVKFAIANPDKTISAKKQYIANHPDKQKEIKDSILLRNPRYFADKAKEYRSRNREEVLVRRRKQDKEKRKSDPLYKLRRVTSNKISSAIIKGGYRKTSKTAIMLGCDWLTFKHHLESKFKPGMTWDNYGEWEIDHKEPCLIANSESELVKLQHYLNLQPLWKQDHVVKTALDIKRISI